MWVIQWWRRRWGAVATVPVLGVSDPTRLIVVDDVSTDLLVVDPVGTHLYPDDVSTSLLWLDSDGNAMAQPLIFTAGETGDLDLQCVGADNAPQDLTGATCTLRVVNSNGTVYANAVSVAVADATNGTVTWNRLTAQVQDAGDFKYQVKAVLAGGQPKYFPNAKAAPGNPLTILPTV